MSSWHRWPRNQVLRKRRKACQPIPGSSRPIAISLSKPAVFEIILQIRCAVPGCEQQSIFATGERSQVLCDIFAYVDIPVSCVRLEAIFRDDGLVAVHLLPYLYGATVVYEMFLFKGQSFSARRPFYTSA